MRPACPLLEGHCVWWGVGNDQVFCEQYSVKFIFCHGHILSAELSPLHLLHGEMLVIRSPWSVVDQNCFSGKQAFTMSMPGQCWLGETNVHLTWWELGYSCGTQCFDVFYPVFKINGNSLPFRSTSFSHFLDTGCQMFSKWVSSISAALCNEIVLRSFFLCGFLEAPGVSGKS